MWLLLKTVVLRWLLARIVARGVLSTLLLVPAAALLKLIGIPLFAVLALVAVPLFLLLGTVGLPFLAALLTGAVVLLGILAVITIGGLLIQLALVAAAMIWIARRVWRLAKDGGSPRTDPAADTP